MDKYTLAPWPIKDGKLVKDFVFVDFNEAFAFMTKVARLAEAMQHHPTWTNTYNKVRIELSTHDTGGITDKDKELARRIDGLM